LPPERNKSKKNETYENKIQIHLTRCMLFIRRNLLCGAVMLIALGVQAQNIFVVNYYYTGPIYEFTPGGAQSTFTSNSGEPEGLAFDSAGNLFVSEEFNGNLYKFTPGGVRSTFATGLGDPTGVAIQGITLPVPEPSALGLLAVGASALIVHCPSPLRYNQELT
jgi:hypothetical protein